MARDEEQRASGIECWNVYEIQPRVNNDVTISYQLPSEAVTIRRSVMKLDVLVPEHAHPYDQVVVVFGGELTIKSDGESFPLSQGMLLRIPAGTVHSADLKAGCDYMELGSGVEAVKH